MSLNIFVILFLLSVPSMAQTEASREPAAEDIDRECSRLYPIRSNDFARSRGFALKTAIVHEFSLNPKTAKASASSAIRQFCGEMLGAKYGFIIFKSSPSGAKIFVDGDEQLKTTDSRLIFKVGVYKYRIKREKKEDCLGKVEVNENATQKVKCS